MEVLVKVVFSWVYLLLMSLLDAWLIGLFFDASNVATLEALGYWQLFWLNLAVLMPIGTGLGLHAVVND